MKMIVETTGSFGLLDPYTGDYLPFNRPCVVNTNEFMATRISLEQLKLLGMVTDKATDKEFVAYLKDSGKPSKKATDLAVASFISAFEPEEDKPKVKPKFKGKGKVNEDG